MKLIINGEAKELRAEEEKLTLEQLIKQLNLHPQLVVIELNGEIVNSNRWKTKSLFDGDRLEIVTIVGGGS